MRKNRDIPIEKDARFRFFVLGAVKGGKYQGIDAISGRKLETIGIRYWHRVSITTGIREAHQRSLSAQLAQALLQPYRRLSAVFVVMWIGTYARD